MEETETETTSPDYYVERGRVIFTEQFLRRRGYCCGYGCRHCPYRKPESTTESTTTATPDSRDTPSASRIE